MFKFKADKIYAFVMLLIFIISFNFVLLINLTFNSLFIYLVSFFGIALPFLTIFFTLFKELRDIEYKKYQYQDSFNIISIIIGSLILWLNFKFQFNQYVLLAIFVLSIVILALVLFFMTKKGEKNTKSGPKIIANK